MYRRINEALKDGSIGEPQVLAVTFGFKGLDLPRQVQKELGGGVIIGIGTYLVSFANMVFGEKPEKIIANGFLNDAGDLKYCFLKYAGLATMAHTLV